MKNEFDTFFWYGRQMKKLSRVLSFLFITLLVWTGASAQEAEGTQEPPVSQEGAQEQDETRPAVEKTDAERVLRLEKVIVSDTERLAELKQDLDAKELDFKDWSAELAEREEKLTAMKARLAEITDAGERQALQAEIDAYAEKYEIVKSATALAFQSERTVREQAEALEKKIGKLRDDASSRPSAM